jgi:HEAT repeat protein
LGWQPTNASQQAEFLIACKDWSTIISLGSSGDIRIIELLIAVALSDGDWDVRRNAVEVLGKISDARAVELLIATLSYGDLDAQSNAINALGEIGCVSAVGPLIATLSDKSIRWGAVLALSKIGSAVVEPLLATLSNEGSRWGAVVALGKVGDARAVEPLIATLSYGDYDVQRSAVIALGEIGDARAVEPLCQIIHAVPCTDDVYVAIARLLEAQASAIPLKNLMFISTLSETFMYFFDEDEGKGHMTGGYNSRPKELARQELIRRGISP